MASARWHSDADSNTVADGRCIQSCRQPMSSSPCRQRHHQEPDMKDRIKDRSKERCWPCLREPDLRRVIADRSLVSRGVLCLDRPETTVNCSRFRCLSKLPSRTASRRTLPGSVPPGSRHPPQLLAMRHRSRITVVQHLSNLISHPTQTKPTSQTITNPDFGEQEPRRNGMTEWPGHGCLRLAWTVQTARTHA